MKYSIVTGAAGFIGSCLITELKLDKDTKIIAVDDFSHPEKKANLEGKEITQFIERNIFIHWFKEHASEVGIVYHIGARTDTTSQDIALFNELNLDYSKAIWKVCVENNIPLIYASSAATYGLGELGYKDDHETIPSLQPLNPYGHSKNDFDKWVLTQENHPPFWAGLKFFNVYGPNEFHKGRMASVIFHAFNQINASGSMKLFKSHREGIENGHQSRDFIYVKDLIKVIRFLKQTQKDSGIYNLGSGVANTFLDLATFTFEAMNKVPDIHFMDTPIDIRETYQYYTCADMSKLRKIGYSEDFYSLKEGVYDYVQTFLIPSRYF
jgi:ADP-L-glycero-D-manno-heptose 6-epimerase